MRTTLEKWRERKEMRGEEGFTLIELLIVIIILAILATVVVFAVGTTTKNAAVAACKSTVKTVQTALEAYKAQTPTGAYPTAIATLTGTRVVNGTTLGPWLKSPPSATKTKNGYAISTYTPTSGTFLVITKTTSGGKTASTKAVCTGA